MPPTDLVRIVERLHGHLGWLAAAALAHPALLLRAPARRADGSVGLATAFVTAVGALGAALYPAYRERLRPEIFQTAPSIGYLFERKEHLAFGTILFAWLGVVAYAASLRAARPGVGSPGGGGGEGDVSASLRRAACWAFAAATLLAIVTATLGTLVAAYRTF